MSKYYTKNTYSDDLIISVMRDYIDKKHSVRELAIKYGIKTTQSITNWAKKLGVYEPEKYTYDWDKIKKLI